MKDLKDFSKMVKDKIDASGIKERVEDVTRKVKVGSVISDIKKGVAKISLGDDSILAFSKRCSKEYIEIGETVSVIIKLQSRYKSGVLDCIVTDVIPPQFELVDDMPLMIYQLKPGEEKEYQYKIKANVGGHFSTQAVCEIENKFSLDDILSNEMEVHVSLLSAQMRACEMTQGHWARLYFVFENISKETIMNITLSLKGDSKFDLEKPETHNRPLPPKQSAEIPLLVKTPESGSVGLDLNVVCIDEDGGRYNVEKDFLIPVTEADKTVTRVDIGAIGEVVASGATQIKDSVIQRSTVGSSGATRKGGDLPAKSKGVEIVDSIVQRSEIGGEAVVGRSCSNCGGEVQEGWKMCPFCGTKLELRCPGCNQKMDEAWHVCPFCGGRLR